jgi:phage terminase small subunit
MTLTEKQKRFVAEYLIDLNATQAAIRAGYSPKTAKEIGAQNLTKLNIQNAIEAAQNKREQRTEITQDMVLQRWWAIATADPNEIIHLRRVCCRHCFGVEHRYQWTDEAEYMRAVESAKASAKEGEQPQIPSDDGGFGFDPLLRPHPKCPKCHGEGFSEIYSADTRDLGSQAKLLYAGLKPTAAGVEIKLHDQQKALESVARHLGMFDDSLRIKGDKDEPLQVNFNIPRPPKSD